MKKLLALATITCLLISGAIHAQDDKSKRPSPPASVKETIASGATVQIDYSQPALKGRVIGKDVEPMKEKVWRMGANEATVFQVDKAVTIDGKSLPAGKYSLWGLMRDKDFTLIFNKAANIWGTQYEENKGKDALRVTVKPETAASPTERLTYKIDHNGKVTMMWGTMEVSFKVK